MGEGPFKSGSDWLFYVLREVHELMWILGGFQVHLPQGVDHKLQKIVQGSDFAYLDKNTNSRNTQFELRIASYFCRAGCRVDLSMGTDIIIWAQNHVFFVECKRVASQAQFAKRLAEARKQLQRNMPKKLAGRRVYGCIAADVTKLAFPHNGLTFGLTPDHCREVIQDKLKEIATGGGSETPFEVFPRLIGYWLQIHIPSLVLNPCTSVTRFSSYHVVLEQNRRRDRRAATHFYDIFERASASRDSHETPAESLRRRQTVALPAGTRFGMDDEILKALSGVGAVLDVPARAASGQ